jgi:hypothetical protein
MAGVGGGALLGDRAPDGALLGALEHGSGVHDRARARRTQRRPHDVAQKRQVDLRSSNAQRWQGTERPHLDIIE